MNVQAKTDSDLIGTLKKKSISPVINYYKVNSRIFVNDRNYIINRNLMIKLVKCCKEKEPKEEERIS